MGRRFFDTWRVHGRRSAAATFAAVVMLGAVSSGCGDDTASPASPLSSSTASTAASTSTTTPPATQLQGASTSAVSVPMPQVDTAKLVAVRIGSHDGYDRVVFELEGELPGYDIGYLEGPVIQDGSGDPVEVAGDAVLSVRLAPASGVVIGVDEVTQTYVGPDRITGDRDPVTEVVRTGDFEAQSSWAIGVTAEQPFAVSTLSSPTRIIVDVASA